jgi:hypothetical protein
VHNGLEQSIRPRCRTVVVWTASAVVVEVLAWFLLRSQGVDFVGDSPSYLIATQALAHLHFSLVPWARQDLVSHYIHSWRPGASLGSSGIQIHYGPHGAVLPHGIGLPVLLAPFMLLGSVPLALLWLFAVNAAGMAYLHRRASHLAGLGRRGQVVFAIAMAAPALFLAATQVFPDFVSGVFAACAYMEIACVERRREVTLQSGLVIAIALAIEPWLQIKNVTLSLIGLLALAAICLRARTALARLGSVAGIVLGSLALLLAYDHYYFGNLLGQHEPPERVNSTTIAHMVALVLDGHQGLLVQVPTVLLGLLGLWFIRRAYPFSASAALLGVAAVLIVNGAQFAPDAMGGTALAGRFQWTAMPILLGWSAFFFQKVPWRRLTIVGTGIAGLWLWEGIPLLLGDHTYINSMIAPFAPWDPNLYPGWWPGLNSVLPALVDVNRNLGVTSLRLAVEILVVLAAALVLVRIADARRMRPLWAAALVAPIGAVLAAGIVGLGTMVTAPTTVTGTALGSPWSASAGLIRSGPELLFAGGPGTYRVTIAYREVPNPKGSPKSAPPEMSFERGNIERQEVSGWLDLDDPTDAAKMTVRPAPVAGAQIVASARLGGVAAALTTRSVRIFLTEASQVYLKLRIGPGSRLSVDSLVLQKLSPG